MTQSGDLVYRALLIASIFLLASFYAIAGEESPRVVIKDYLFTPQHITIKTGQTVVWENREKRQFHSVWFKALGEEEPEDYLFADDTYERTFPEAGVFPYRCGPHPEMTGSVTVVD